MQAIFSDLPLPCHIFTSHNTATVAQGGVQRLCLRQSNLSKPVYMKYGIILVSKEREYIYYSGRVVFAEAYQPRHPIQLTGQVDDRGLQNCDYGGTAPKFCMFHRA